MRRFSIREGGKLLDSVQLRRGVVRKDKGESRPGVLKVRLTVRSTMTSTHIDVRSLTSIFLTFIFMYIQEKKVRKCADFLLGIFHINFRYNRERFICVFTSVRSRWRRRTRFSEILFSSEKRSDADTS